MKSERWPSCDIRTKHNDDNDEQYLKMWSSVLIRLMSLIFVCILNDINNGANRILKDFIINILLLTINNDNKKYLNI